MFCGPSEEAWKVLKSLIGQKGWRTLVIIIIIFIINIRAEIFKTKLTWKDCEAQVWLKRSSFLKKIQNIKSYISNAPEFMWAKFYVSFNIHYVKKSHPKQRELEVFLLLDFNDLRTSTSCNVITEETIRKYFWFAVTSTVASLNNQS